MNDFGKWLKTTRKSKGMAQRELASITGMRPCTICGYEKGRFYPSIYAVEQLVNALGYELVIRDMSEQRSVTEQIEDIKTDICNKYCKYPDIWDEEAEGCELCESEVCTNCPLNRL